MEGDLGKLIVAKGFENLSEVKSTNLVTLGSFFFLILFLLSTKFKCHRRLKFDAFTLL